MNSTKVLVLLPYLNRHLAQLITYLNSNFESDFYIIGDSNKFRTTFQNDFYLTTLRQIKYHTAIQRLLSHNYDVILFHGIFYLNFLPILLSLNKSNIFILSESFNPSLYKRSTAQLKKWIVKIINRNTNSIHLVALGFRSIQEQYKLLGLRVDHFHQSAYLPQLQNHFSENKKMKNGRIRMAFVGQFIERKNINLLHQLINSHEWGKLESKVDFYLIGNGSLDDFKSPYKNIKVITNYSRKEVIEFMEEVDVLLLPSLFDGWGAVVNEAISVGCALLLSPYVGAAEVLLEEGKNGFIVSTNNYLDIMKHLNNWTSNPANLAQMQANSATIFNEKHKPEVQYSFLK